MNLKKFKQLGILTGLILCMTLVGCDSNIESDATRMAKKSLELEKVQKQMGNRSNLGGKRMSNDEYNEYCRDYINFANKMSEKYSETLEQHRAFSKLVEQKKRELRNK